MEREEPTARPDMGTLGGHDWGEMLMPNIQLDILS